MLKENYERVEMEIIRFRSEDILTGSENGPFVPGSVTGTHSGSVI